MAINYELLNKGGISLGTNFELLSEKPLDSRLVVPSLDGLQNYIDNAAAYEGMIAYVTSEKKHYEVKVIDGVLSYRPFGLTEAELNDLITNATTAAMEFKGATTTLPENPAKGDMYKVAGENINIKIDDVDAKLGDSIVYDGEKWFLIPSGDDIEDTWRPVEGVNNDATIKFADGDKTVAAVAADGTIKYNHATVAKPEDITDAEAGDLNTRTYITAVETDGYGHITGYKTATENVVDTNTEYTFESQVESSSVYFNVTPNTEDATEETIYVDAYSKNEADGKFVAKETGKSLLSDTEIARLADVNNYDDEEVRGLIGDNADAIDALSEYVGTIPNVPGEDGNNKYADLDVIGYINKKAQETLAAASGNSSETAASVKGQLDDYIGENNTRVKAIEDDVAALEEASATHATKDELNEVDAKFANYNTTEAQKAIDDAQDAEIAKKVNKTDYEADKATFATKTELGDVDKKFADYKTAVDQKVIDDAQDAEIAKKVDKVDGKDLIATSEIERLATLKNYDDTALAGRVTTAEGKITALETESAKHALKTELEAVDAKFADYKTAEAQKAIDDEQDRRLGVLEGASATHATKDELAGVDAKFADYTKTADLPTDLGDFTNNAKYAKTADVEAELVKKADKSVVDAMYTNTQIDTAVQGAKDYAKGLVDAIPAQTDYTVTITEATDGLDAGIAKKYTFTQNGAEIGTINLAKELVVTAGSVKEVTEADAPYAGAKVGDKYIELVIANQDAPIYVPAKDLVDIYTAKDMTGIEGAEVQVAISNTNEISATLVNGGITEEKLAEGVKTKLNKTWEEVGVAKGLVDALAETHATDKAALEDAIETAKTEAANQAAVVLAESQKYADQTKADAIADAATKYETIGTAQGIVDGLKLSETYELAGAEGRAIAAAEGKVNALAGEGNTSTVKKNADDIASLFEMFQWGSF